MKKFVFITFSLLLALVARQALAEVEELAIKDTAGIIRNSTEVQTSASVEFTVSDPSGMPADGAEILLKNEATGEELHAVSANGLVHFDNVQAGTWIVSSSTSNITFTNIVVSSAYAAGLTGIGYAAPLAVLAGGGAVAGTTIAIVDANRNHDTTLSPTW